MSLRWLFLLGMLSMSCASVERFDAGDEQAVRALLEEQRTAWNRGDIEGFVDGYERSAQLSFAGADGVTRGWADLLTRYQRRYPDIAAMGELKFDLFEVRPLAKSAALVIGEWRLMRESDSPGGIFSLIVEHQMDGWKVIHDHTSSYPTETED